MLSKGDRGSIVSRRIRLGDEVRRQDHNQYAHHQGQRDYRDDEVNDAHLAEPEADEA